MEERQVTLDGNTQALSQFFTVFATQNPIEFEGTYPLPEAQLDRFLLKIRMVYPDAKEEAEILQHYQDGFDPRYLERLGLHPLPADWLTEARAEVAAVRVGAGAISICYEHCAAFTRLAIVKFGG